MYQGHHGDAGAHRADVILPGAAYTEKDAIFVNTEGRPQVTRRAVFPPGEAREDWKILRAFSQTIGKPLPYDTLDELRAKMLTDVPALAAVGQRAASEWQPAGKAGALSSESFTPAIANFYMTDPICRASVTMAKCTAEILPLITAEAAE